VPGEAAATGGAVVLGGIEVDDVLRRLARDRVERGERLLLEFGDRGTRVTARDREQVLRASTVRRTGAGRRDDLGLDAGSGEDPADLTQAREAALGHEDGIGERHDQSLRHAATELRRALALDLRPDR